MTAKKISKKTLRKLDKFIDEFLGSRMDPKEERDSNNALLRALEPRLAKYEKLLRAPLNRFQRRGSHAA